MSKSTKQLENDIHELRVNRAAQWQLGKKNRDDSLIQRHHDMINKLKRTVTEKYER